MIQSKRIQKMSTIQKIIFSGLSGGTFLVSLLLLAELMLYLFQDFFGFWIILGWYPFYISDFLKPFIDINITIFSIPLYVFTSLLFYFLIGFLIGILVYKLYLMKK